MAELLEPFAGDAAVEVAQRLIDRFGSLERLLGASLSQLRHAAGGHERACAAIFAARRLVDAALREELVGTPVDSSDPLLHRYLRHQIGGMPAERLLVIYCDRERRYLGDELVAAGSLSRIEARARPLVERALEVGAAGLLLAHNHPSGDCRPSALDVSETKRLSTIIEALELHLIDHLVVTRTRVFSMRSGGHL
ncbi:JAB domain-containing protein [Tsuneonella mangrovi]|uniref:JAB domain-containing protein n=1 Tax=Tsuneonella mangrovi TaxID=1982042 RepID=UPI000BA1DF1C|nr:JAB domain-containing protein [Tsuneonella mangrovi]